MSRIGKQPIELKSQAKVSISGQDVTVAGPKGSLSFALPACVSARQEENMLLVECSSFEKNPKNRALYGMVRSILNNMVQGVTDGFKRQLEIQGVGYRGQCSGKRLILNLGYSHPVEFVAPEGVDISMPDNTHIVVEGIDKQAVGQVAATIRGFRPPDAYKGKGIRYQGEQISLKEGKTVG
jgi:large subunit ribosomal protein L6